MSNITTEAKKNGKATQKATTTTKPTTAKAQPKIVQDNIWSLCRLWVGEGKKDPEIKKAAETWLMKNISPEEALKAWSTRLAQRAVWRAKRQIKKAGKGK